MLQLQRAGRAWHTAHSWAPWTANTGDIAADNTLLLGARSEYPAVASAIIARINTAGHTMLEGFGSHAGATALQVRATLWLEGCVLCAICRQLCAAGRDMDICGTHCWG